MDGLIDYMANEGEGSVAWEILAHRFFWPVCSLLALLIVNTVARPQFMKITVRDGELYGAIIDILRNSAPLMLVALGMTLVIATTASTSPSAP